MHNEFNGLEKIDLASAELHGPVEVKLSVYMKLPDGQIGSMGVILQPGRLPTRGELHAVFTHSTLSIAGEIPGAPVGARPLTRSEFVAHVTKRETGAPFLMPADAEFAPVPADVPHMMLVHAIMGAGVWPELQPEFEERGLGHFSHIVNRFDWDEEALAALPDDMLLAIYERVSA